MNLLPLVSLGWECGVYPQVIHTVCDDDHPGSVANLVANGGEVFLEEIPR